MPTARYIFVRANSAQGYLAPVRISAEAITALNEWSRLSEGRGYKVETENDAELVAALKWDASDHATAEDLRLYCEAYGVERLFISL